MSLLTPPTSPPTTGTSSTDRQLNTKSLAGIQNNTASIVAPEFIFFCNSYAFDFSVDSTSGASNLWAHQIPLTSGTAVPGTLQLSSSNNNNYFTATHSLSSYTDRKHRLRSLPCWSQSEYYQLHCWCDRSWNSFTLSKTFDTPYSLSLTCGEALGSRSQLFAVWSENGFLKDDAIDVGNRTVATPSNCHSWLQ